MGLRLIQIGNSLPYSFPVDPASNFQPGQAGQLNVLGNQLVMGKSDGSAPFGIIDDIKTVSFTAVSFNETIIVRVPNPILNSSNQLVNPYDIKAELENPNILPTSFISLDIAVQLLPRNGVIVFPAGTVLNCDVAGTGTPDAFRTVVNYAYTIPNHAGDDSTQGSQRVTVWFQRMIVEVDTFDPTANYPVNANLFINEDGNFTTKQPSPNYPSVGLVIAPPSPIIPSLQLLWL